MYLTQSNIIRGLSHEEYKLLKEMCWYAKNLYNVGLYNIRQHYFNEKRFLAYESNYHECKTNENYKLLQAGVSQQILKVVDRSFKSFFNLMKKAKHGEYRYQDIKIPKYLPKDGLFVLVLSTNAINIKDGFIYLPTSIAFNKLHPNTKIKIPFPQKLVDKKIKEVRIIPLYKGHFFKIQYVYEADTEDLALNPNHSLAIDIGLENLATCVDSQNGASFIMDGRKLKSINHFYNKRKAYFQVIASKQDLKSTKRLNALTLKRNNQVNDYIKKTARYIINYCISHDIGTLVVGYNSDFKRHINLGKATNQQFNQISFGALRGQLANLCEQYSIQYIEQEESYTSKASFLEQDDMPIFTPGDEQKYNFSGKRIKRGLYQSKNKQLLNADVNGACNILVKSKQKFDFKQLCKGLLVSPIRIRIT